MKNYNVHELTATEIVAAVQNKSLDVNLLADAYIDRAEKLNPILHSWSSFSAEYVYSQYAQLGDKACTGLLGGVPVGIKDVFNTEYYNCEKGSAAWRGYKPGNDARCVSYLRNHGAVIFGKTDTAELAVHANGMAKNPYNLEHVTGSSSGGSAVAVATAMVPVALGTQTGGSTIRPASWCGVYGMKPTFGLIPRTGVLKTTDTLDTIGYFARCAQDLALMFEVSRVHGDNFPIQEGRLNDYRAHTNRKWRVAFCRSHLDDVTLPYVLSAFDMFKRELKQLGDIELIELDLPKSTLEFQSLHRRIYHPCLSYYLRNELAHSPEKVSSVLKAIFEDADTIPPEDFALALKEQTQLASDMEEFFIANEIDTILTNSSNGSAPKLAEPSQHLDLNQLWTMTWLPVINIPQFKCPNQLPFGLTAVGPRYSDYKLMAFLQYLVDRGVVPERTDIMGDDLLMASQAKLAVSG